MTDLLRLATELERSGGMHRFIALVQAASLVLLRFEHGESGVGMSDKTAGGLKCPWCCEFGLGCTEDDEGGYCERYRIHWTNTMRGTASRAPAADIDAGGSSSAPDERCPSAGTGEALASMRVGATRYRGALAGLAKSDCQGETPDLPADWVERCTEAATAMRLHPRGGITHADDSPLMPRRMVPRFAAPIEEDGE